MRTSFATGVMTAVTQFTVVIALPAWVSSTVSTVHGKTVRSLQDMVEGISGASDVQHPSPFITIQDVLPTEVFIYAAASDEQGQLVTMDANGVWFSPQCPAEGIQNISSPSGSTITMRLPAKSFQKISLPRMLSSGRIYAATGELPFSVTKNEVQCPALVQPTIATMVHFGFIELTYTGNNELWANPSGFNFLGLPMSVRSAPDHVAGFYANTTERLCEDLTNSVTASGPWDELCIRDAAGKPLYVMSPENYQSNVPNAFDSSFGEYPSKPWTSAMHLPLIFQTSLGQITCQTDPEAFLLQCTQCNRALPVPTGSDIISCSSGPFQAKDGDNAYLQAAIRPLCTMMNRGEYIPDTMSGDSTQLEGNWYAMYGHKYTTNEGAYLFAYDDNGRHGSRGLAGLLSAKEPEKFEIFVGGGPPELDHY